MVCLKYACILLYVNFIRIWFLPEYIMVFLFINVLEKNLLSIRKIRFLGEKKKIHI